MNHRHCKIQLPGNDETTCIEFASNRAATMKNLQRRLVLRMVSVGDFEYGQDRLLGEIEVVIVIFGVGQLVCNVCVGSACLQLCCATLSALCFVKVGRGDLGTQAGVKWQLMLRWSGSSGWGAVAAQARVEW